MIHPLSNYMEPLLISKIYQQDEDDNNDDDEEKGGTIISILGHYFMIYPSLIQLYKNTFLLGLIVGSFFTWIVMIVFSLLFLHVSKGRSQVNDYKRGAQITALIETMSLLIIFLGLSSIMYFKKYRTR